MKNKLFFIDEAVDSSISYDDLLKTINNSSNSVSNSPLSKSGIFIINLIAGIASGCNIILQGDDISLVDKDKNIYNCSNDLFRPVKNIFYSNYEELKEKIKTSPTNITIFTSGTTGQPKKIIHNMPNLLRGIRYGDKFNNNIWGLCYKPSHMGGLQVIFQAIMNGNTIVNLYHFNKTQILNSLIKNCITHISATPTFYRLLLPADFVASSITNLTLGGEKSDTQLYDKLKLIFPNARISNIYATTEAASLLISHDDIFSVPEEHKQHIKILENELVIHRSLIGSNEFIDGDWYYTGDLVEVINECPLKFKIIARKNEMINVGGYKVNPEEIENAINSHSDVISSYAFGKKNSVLGNALIAEVVLEAASSLTEPMLREYLQDLLPSYKIPQLIKFVKEIEITSNNKLKRI